MLEQNNILLDSGRGMLLYIKKTFKKLDISTIANTNRSEIIAVELKLKEKIIHACVYRSPNSLPDNSNNINKSLEILSGRFSPNLLVAGNFNYPKINWEHYSTTSSPNDLNSKFFECTIDCFFNQFISEPIRGRGLSQPTLIDLVLTNNSDIIDKVKLESPLGKSDHTVVEIIMENVLLTKNKKFILNYKKENYEKMKSLFNQDFVTRIENCEDVSDQYNMLLELLHEAINKYISRMSLSNNKLNRKTTISRSAKSKVRQNHRLWKSYVQTNNITAYKKYRKISNQIRPFTRLSIKNFEINICDDVKNNPKNFWKYVNNKRKANVSIPQLYKLNTNKKVCCETDYDKAEPLASQFNTAFTIEKENTWNIEEKTLPDSKLVDSKLVISFDAATILKNLNGLNTSKSSGLYLVNVKMLKELAEPIAPVYQQYLKSHMILVVYRQNGRKQILALFTKKETNIIRPISLISLFAKL